MTLEPRMLSATQYEMWQDCEVQWYRRYGRGEKIPPGIAMLTGNALHAASAINFRTKVETGEDQPLDTLQDAARDAYVHAVVSSGVFIPMDQRPGATLAIARGQDQAVALVSPFRWEFAPQIAPVLVEQRIVLTVSELPQIVCYPDTYTSGGRLCEQKTAARAWPQARADASVQATLYREAVRVATGSYPRIISIDQFIKGERPRYEVTATVRTTDDFRVLCTKLAIMCQRITAGVFKPANPEHFKCSPRYCGYWYTCEYIPPHRRLLPRRSN